MSKGRWYGCLVAAIVSMGLGGSIVSAQEVVKMAVVASMGGPAAAAYGTGSKNAAELLIDAINAGRLPAPYNTPGLGGKKIEVIFVDEEGGNTKQAGEFRNLVQKRGVEIVFGYVSSGVCAAIAPIADELKTLTLFSLCGATRILEVPRTHVFRTQMTAAAEGIAAARYVSETMPKLKSYTGINQNYAWGQDAWNDFAAAMKQLSPALVSDKPLWTKIFQAEFSSEVSALSLSKDELIMSSFWGADVDSFVQQASLRNLLADKKLFLTTGAAEGIYRIGSRMPNGVIVGARGPYGVFAADNTTPLHTWFVTEYEKRYGPITSVATYQSANGILALKAAYDKASRTKKSNISTADAIAALKGLTYDGITSKVTMARSGGHQAVMEMGYGVTKWDESRKKITLTNVKFYSPECIQPPDGISSDNWIAGGMKGAKCR